MTTPKIDVFILAAGLGLRARPLSRVRPKALFPLGGTPLIRLLLQHLDHPVVSRYFVNLHYLGGAIRRHLGDMRNIHFLEEESLSGSRILKRGRSRSSPPLLAVNGDVYMEPPINALLGEYLRSSCDGVLLVRPRGARAYSAVEHENGWYRGTRNPSLPGDLMYCGAGLFSPLFVQSIRHDSFFQSLESTRLRVRLLEYDGIWLDLGTPDLYHRSQFAFLQHRGLPGTAAHSASSRVAPDCRTQRCILWDDVAISGGSRLSKCIVADGVRLDGAVMAGRVITAETTVPL